MKKYILFLIVLTILSSCNKTDNKVSPIYPVPNEYQLKWHEMEEYAFVHFGLNTFTGKQWGYGDESPKLFNPQQLNVEQWISLFKEVGMKGVILTCKHHDGFCLWPSKYTEHSIKNSPYKNGKGDIVKEVSEACKKYGLKFGVYLSPWDRNSEYYGKPEYITYYRNQLNELIDNYGPFFEIWFDGANGGDGFYGGNREMRKIDAKSYYDWPTTIAMLREKNPETLLFSDAGPDLRWCGNESGFIGETNWNFLNTDTLYAGIGGKIFNLLNTGDINGKKWVPAEVDVPNRPGWFYNEADNDKVLTPEHLLKIYLESVGRGSCLLLNIPPDNRGLINENDIKSLKQWKHLKDSIFSNNIARDASIKTTNTRNGNNFGSNNLNDNNPNTYWATDDNITNADIIVEFNTTKLVNYIMLQEYIKLGQRIKKFNIEIFEEGEWRNIVSASTIGYKRIIPIEPCKTKKVKIRIIDSRACPVISNLEIY